MTRQKYLIEVIQMKEMVNTHVLKRTDDLFTEINIKKEDESNVTITVAPRDLYEVETNLFKGFWVWATKGQKKHYLMIVDKEGNPITEGSATISGKVLKVARDWKGLDGAVKDSFGSSLGMGRLGFIGLIVVAVIVLGVLVWRGVIPLPRSWTA